MIVIPEGPHLRVVLDGLRPWAPGAPLDRASCPDMARVRWQSPQVLKDHRAGNTAKNDVYMFGGVLYELLTGGGAREAMTGWLLTWLLT